MKDKILSLASNEEIQIIGHKCKASLKIENSKEKLHIKELDVINDKPNMEVVTFNFDDLKQYVLFESYYLTIMESGKLPSEIEDYITKLMNYHENKIYGKCGEDLDVEDYDYQCVLHY